MAEATILKTGEQEVAAPIATVVEQAKDLGDHGARLEFLEAGHQATSDSLADIKNVVDNLDDRIKSVADSVYQAIAPPVVDTEVIANSVKDKILAEATKVEEKVETAAEPPKPETPPVAEKKSPVEGFFAHLKRLL